MRTFSGTVRVRLDTEAGRVFLDRGVAGSTLTADDATKIVTIAVEAAKTHKVALDRWSFYVKGESEKLPEDPKAPLPAAVVAKALKENFKVSLRAVRFGKPAIWLLPDTPTPVKVSKFQDLA